VAVAAAAAAGLVAVERRHPSPMLPLSLFARPRFSVANAVAGTMNLGTLGCVYLLTLYLQVVRHRSPLAAGLAMVPLFAPLSLVAPLSGRLAGRFGPRWPMAAGLTIAACGLALLATVGRSSAYGPLLAALLLWGGGIGLLSSAVVSAAVDAVERERSGLASAVNNTARQAGGAVGIAAFGALAGEASGAGFVHGMHLAALIAAGLYLLAVVPTVAWLGR